jgi:hypothetical protein
MIFMISSRVMTCLLILSESLWRHYGTERTAALQGKKAPQGTKKKGFVACPRRGGQAFIFRLARGAMGWPSLWNQRVRRRDFRYQYRTLPTSTCTKPEFG